MSLSTSSSHKSLNWGVLSTAEIGVESVIPAIQQSKNGKVVAIASRSEARAENVARSAGIPKSFGSYEELLKSPEIDAVYIPLPNGLHCEWTIRAAELGKHVLCEKSISVTSDECRRMISACDSHHVRLMEAFMYRFHPQIERLRAEIASGIIGSMLQANSRFSYRSVEKNDIRYQKNLGGGSLLDMGCYCINAALMMFESTPVEAKAWSWIDAKSGVDEMTVGALKFSDTKVLVFECGFIAQPSNTFEIIGTKGTIRLRQAFRVGPDDTPEISVWVDENGRKNPLIIKSERANHYKLMVEHFSDCVVQDRTTAYPPTELLKNMKALEMIQKVQENF